MIQKKLSASRINTYLRSKTEYLAKYILNYRSSEPAIAAIRGKAIESALIEYSMDTVNEDFHILAEINFTNEVGNEIVKHFDLDAEVYRKTSIPELYRILSEKFPEKESEINQIFEKYNKEKSKIEKISMNSIDLILRKFDLSKFKYQHHAEKEYNENLIVHGFIDFYSDYGCIDLKTSSEKREIKLSEKIQLATYLYLTGSLQSIVLVYPVSEEENKIRSIHDYANQGMSIEEIFKTYRSPDGGKTTKKYIEKVLVHNIQPDSGVVFYEPTIDELLPYQSILFKTIESMIFLESICNKDLELYKKLLIGFEYEWIEKDIQNNLFKEFGIKI